MTESILTGEEAARLDRTIRALGAAGVYRPSRRAEAAAEIEGMVREACARMMDDVSNCDPLRGPVWAACLLGAGRIRGDG